MGSLYHVTRAHYEYNGAGKIEYLFETDDNNAIDGGLCRTSKYTYNVSNQVENMVMWHSNGWQAAWNLDKTVVLA